MLSPMGSIPKVVTVREKLTQKWKVVFLGGKKKMSTGSILAPAGNPTWDYEVTFKVDKRGEPISLLVTDSDDHHVGQIVIPVAAMPPRPTNSSERPTDPSRLQIADLEPTKKVDNPIGSLQYWVWVEEYRTDDGDSKSHHGSILSIASRHHKKHGSVAGSLDYRGSVVSMDSTQSTSKDGKKKHHNPFKRRKDILKSAADLSVGHRKSRDVNRSSSQIYDPTFRGSFVSDNDYNRDDHDGSILGSDMSTSDMGGPRPTSHLSFVSQPPGGGMANGSVTQVVGGAQRPMSYASPLGQTSQSPQRPIGASLVPPENPTSALGSRSSSPNPSERKPLLIKLEPTSCSIQGGTEVTVFCRGLTEEVIRYATVIVDGVAVQRQDWFMEEASRSNQSEYIELRIHMPERPAGRCWIELETMRHGRVRCPQEFTYMESPKALSTANLGTIEEKDQSSSVRAPSMPGHDESGDSPPNASSLVRIGSNRSGMRVSDRRSTRRERRRPGELILPNHSQPLSTTMEAEKIEGKVAASVAMATNASPDNGSKNDSPETIFERVSISREPPPPPSSSSNVHQGSPSHRLVLLDRRSTRRRQTESTSNNDRADSVTDEPLEVKQPTSPTANSSPFRRGDSRSSGIIAVDRRSQRRSGSGSMRKPNEESRLPNLPGSISSASSPKVRSPTVSPFGSPRSSLRQSGSRMRSPPAVERHRLDEEAGGGIPPKTTMEGEKHVAEQPENKDAGYREDIPSLEESVTVSNERPEEQRFTSSSNEDSKTPPIIDRSPSPVIGSSSQIDSLSVERGVADMVYNSPQQTPFSLDPPTQTPQVDVAVVRESSPGELATPKDTDESIGSIDQSVANVTTDTASISDSPQPSRNAEEEEEGVHLTDDIPYNPNSLWDNSVQPLHDSGPNSPKHSLSLFTIRELTEPVHKTTEKTDEVDTMATALVTSSPEPEVENDDNVVLSPIDSELSPSRHFPLLGIPHPPMKTTSPAITRAGSERSLPSAHPLTSESDDTDGPEPSNTTSPTPALMETDDEAETGEEGPSNGSPGRYFASLSQDNSTILRTRPNGSSLLSLSKQPNKVWDEEGTATMAEKDFPDDLDAETHHDDYSPNGKSVMSQPSVTNYDSGLSSLPDQPTSMKRREREAMVRGPTTNTPVVNQIHSDSPDEEEEEEQSPPIHSARHGRTSVKSAAPLDDSSDEDERPVETLKPETVKFSARSRGSDQNAGSRGSKSAIDDSAKLENDGLRAMLTDANGLIEDMKKQTIDLEQNLSIRTADVERLSTELCTLRNRLLQDGATKYLEKNTSDWRM